MPVVFLHGLGQDSSSWKETISCLTTTVLTPNLFSLVDRYTYSDLFTAFTQYCSQFTGKIDLCGLSLGAVLSLHYAVAYPDRVKSLVLIAPQYRMPKMLLKLQNLFFHLLPDSAFQDTGLNKEEMIQLTDSMTKLDFSGGLTKITCPVLILCGEKDRANRKAAISLAKQLHTMVQFIPGAGHEVNLQAPLNLAHIIHNFYQDHNV